MRYRGEITVFLSLTLICVLSLVLGLVESARTAGARLYLRMASDSAVSSVMSYYNRNLWDRYQLLFLEYESEEAIKETFGRYLDFYLEQANMYPARRENARHWYQKKTGSGVPCHLHALWHQYAPAGGHRRADL